MLYIKDVAFEGIQDFAPDENKGAMVELARRLERFNNSLMHQLRRQPTIFSNVDSDPPAGQKAGDVWCHRDGTFQVYNGSDWIP